jgi:hypothetical protein
MYGLVGYLTLQFNLVSARDLLGGRLSMRRCCQGSRSLSQISYLYQLASMLMRRIISTILETLESQSLNTNG